MTNLKIAVLCLACIVFLAVGLVSLRAYQAAPTPMNKGTSAADELKRAQDNLKRAEAAVAELEAAAKAKAERAARYKTTITDYYTRLGLPAAALNEQRAKVAAAEAEVREARAKVEAGNKQMTGILDEHKKDPKKMDAATVALCQAKLKRYEAEVAVAEAKLQVEKLTLDDLQRKAEVANRREALEKWVSTGKGGTLEARVGVLEKAVEELRAELKALRSKPGTGLFDPKRPSSSSTPPPTK